MDWTIMQITSVVLCAMGSGLLLSSFGQSPIIGYIIAGIALGPSCLKVITDTHAIAIFAEMGILFLLFTIGLSLSLEKIKNIWQKSFLVTTLSMLAIYVIMLAVGFLFKIPHSGIILMTFCVTLSSTAVTVKSLKCLKGHDKEIESSTYGILISQDIFALIMVIIINFLGHGEKSTNDLYKLIYIFIFFGLLTIAFLRIDKYIHKISNFIKKHNEMLTLIVFGICLGNAVIAEFFGLSAAFGSFVAGLILGNSSMKEDIQNITAPIEEILLMTFFLSVGLMFDINFIMSNITIILFGLFFITVGKTVLNIFILRICNFSLKESFVIGVLLGHIGEFAFMLSFAASKVGIIDAFGLKFLVCLTALSLFLSSFWLMFAERCRVMARNIKIKSSLEFSHFIIERESKRIKYAAKTIKRPIMNVVFLIKNKFRKDD